LKATFEEANKLDNILTDLYFCLKFIFFTQTMSDFEVMIITLITIIYQVIQLEK